MEIEFGIKYLGKADPSLADPHFRAHVYTDEQVWTGEEKAERCLPWAEFPFVQETIPPWVTVKVPTRGGAVSLIIVDIKCDWVADSDGQPSGPPALPGRTRATAVFEASELRGDKVMTRDLRSTDDGALLRGHVYARASLAGAQIVKNEMQKARRLGAELAHACGPGRGCVPLVNGLSSIHFEYLNEPTYRRPVFAWMLSRPAEPESAAFVEGLVRAAATRRGISLDALPALAMSALADIGNQEERERPAEDTVRFARLVAEGVLLAVQSVFYSTDMKDDNLVGNEYSERKIRPIEDWSANLRGERAGDCEDYGREVVELFRGIRRVEGNSAVVRAARSVARLYVAFATMGATPRSPDMGKDYDQYNMGEMAEGEECNAHSWAVLKSTNSAEALASAFHGSVEDAHEIELAPDMQRGPWRRGLPMQIIDGTTPKACTRGEPDARTECAKRIASYRFAIVAEPMTVDYYRYAHSGYVAHEFVSKKTAGTAYVVSFYTRGDPHAYGVTMAALWEAGEDPHDTSGIFIAAPCVPTPDQIKQIRPLLALSHPLAPYATPALHPDQGVVALFAEAAAAAGVSVAPGRPPPAADPWMRPHSTVVIRHKDITRPNLDAVAAVIAGSEGVTVYAEVVEFIATESQLWITVM